MVDKIILELPADTVGGDILVSAETRERAEQAAALGAHDALIYLADLQQSRKYLRQHNRWQPCLVRPS